VRRRAGGLEHSPYGDQRPCELMGVQGARGDDGSMLFIRLRPAAPPPWFCAGYVRSEFDGFSMRLSHGYVDISAIAASVSLSVRCATI